MLLSSCSTTIPQGYPFDASTGSFKYDNVIQLEGKNADEIYSSIKSWVGLNYKSAQNVIQLDDPVNHKMIVKGNFGTSHFGKNGWYPHIITFESKENRYKYSVLVTSYYSTGSGDMKFNSPSMGFKNKIFKDVDSNVKSTLENLKQHLQGSISSENSEW